MSVLERPAYVRHLCRSDYARIARIEADSLETERNHYQMWLPDDYERHTHSPHGHLKAVVSASVMGDPGDSGSTVGILAYDINPGYVELVRLVIDPNGRRRGSGAAAVRHVIDIALRGKDRGVYARAIVPEKMLTFQLFLKACGFKWEETLLDLDSKEDQYLMTWRP